MRSFQAIIVGVSMAACLSCGRSANDYVQKGVQFLEHGQYADADLNFRKAIQKDPNYGAAYYQLGLLELKQNHSKEAFAALSRAVELLPAEDEPKLKLAEISLSFYLLDTSHPRNLYDLLIRLSDHFLAKNPNSFDGLRIKGVLALVDKKPADAVQYLQAANRVKPLQPDLILILAQALIQNEQYREAEQTALELIGKDKTFGPIYILLFRYYADHNRLEDAENILKLQASNNPDRADSWLQLAVLYTRMGKREQTTAALQHLLDNPKTFPQAHLQAGQFYQANGATKEAIEQYEAGLQTASADKPEYLKKLGQLLAAEGKTDDALPYLNELVKLQPQNSEALGLKAGTLLNSNSPQNKATAVQILRDLVSKNSDDPNLREQLGSAYLIQGNSDAAVKEFLEALKKKPSFIPALLSLAEISRDRHDYSALLRYTDEVLKHDNANSKARLLRVAGLMGAGVYDQAGAELNRLSKESPQSRDVQLQLGLLEIKQNRYAEAERLFRGLYRPGDRDLRALEGLAEVYFGQNQPERALELWTAEIQKSPTIRQCARNWRRAPSARKSIPLRSRNTKNYSRPIRVPQNCTRVWERFIWRRVIPIARGRIAKGSGSEPECAHGSIPGVCRTTSRTSGRCRKGISRGSCGRARQRPGAE
jgi:tetratricopeptide (TPR) repeat protein